MVEITLIEREMTEEELARMNDGFNEHTIENGNPLESAERFGYVAFAGDSFAGCSSGLAYRHVKGYSSWFYLSDLFVEKTYRGKGVGARLLKSLECQIKPLGIRYIYTWTAGYEAPEFYKRQGYAVFTEFENYYLSGHSRVGLRKTL